MTKTEAKREIARLEAQLESIEDARSKLDSEQESKEIRLHELECLVEELEA